MTPTTASRRRRSLKTDISILFLTLGLSILIIATALTLYVNFRAQQQFVDEQLTLIAKDAASTVKGYVVGKKDLLEQSTLASGFATASQSVQQRMMNTLIGNEPSFRQVIYFDEQGREALSASRLSRLGVEDLKMRLPETLFTTTKDMQAYIGSGSIDEVTCEPLLIIATPVTDSFGDYKGTMVAELNLKFMWDVVNSLHVGQKGVAYVVDDQGNLLAFNDVGRVLRRENMAYLDEVREFTTVRHDVHDSKAERAVGILGTTVITTHEHLGEPGWAVVVEVPLREAYSTLFTILLISLVFALFVSLAATAAGIHFSKEISKPIIALRDAAKEVGKGNLRTTIETDADNEIGELADSFNTMTKDLLKSKEEIERNNKQITELLELKTQFVNQVAHDLRTPLTPMLLLLPPLKERIKGKLSKEDIESLEVVINNAQYLSTLVRDTLNIARLDAGKVTFDVQPHTAADLVDEALRGRDVLFKQNNIKVINDIHRHTEITVYADKTRVLEVIDNIVGNALKFMNREGEKTLTFAIGSDEEKATFTIKDNGIGIEQKALQQIFTEFFKADPSRHEAAGSSGLGLAICKRLIESQGGKIWAESEGIGKGSTFRFTLPLYKGQKTAQSQPQ